MCGGWPPRFAEEEQTGLFGILPDGSDTETMGISAYTREEVQRQVARFAKRIQAYRQAPDAPRDPGAAD